MSKDVFYKDLEPTWHNYCVNSEPKEIEKVIKEEFIVSGGKKIHLDIYGANEKSQKTIMFIHGTAVYSRFYADFLYGLYKKGFRIVAPDLPGHGLSSGRRGHFNMKELLNVLYDVCSYINENFNGKIASMGSSLGGIITLYVVANDNRISAGVCHNTAILNEGAHKRIVKVKGFYKYLKPLVPILSKILPIFKLSVWIYLDPYKLIKNEEWYNKIQILLNDKLVSDKYTLKSLATQMRAKLPKPVEEIDTPIMIIDGTDDVLFSTEYMKEIFDKLQNSKNKKLEIIENGSHLILHENRDECIEKISEWLNSVL